MHHLLESIVSLEVEGVSFRLLLRSDGRPSFDQRSMIPSMMSNFLNILWLESLLESLQQPVFVPDFVVAAAVAVVVVVAVAVDSCASFWPDDSAVH